MNDEARLMMTVWEAVSDYVSSGCKQDAADALVGAFVEVGHDVELLYDADGECPYLDRALASAATEEEEPALDEEEW